MRDPSVLILGGGVAGLSTAWSLAQAGARGVTLLEREPTLGAHSTGRNAAILRSVVGTPATRALAAEGSAFLRRPPAGFARAPLVDPCGVLLLAGERQAEALCEWSHDLRGRTPTRELDAAAVRALAPHWRGPFARAVLAPDEGRVDVSELVEAFARGARAGGVEIATGVRAEWLLVEGGRVRGALLGDGSALRADVTVVAAGGFAGALGRAAGSRLDLAPMRRHLAVTAPDPRVDPRWPVVWTLEDEFYARPESGGLLVCACDEARVDPEACATEPDVRAEIARKVALHAPAFADATLASLWCGLRTFAEDRRFAIGRDPDVGGLFWVAGLGGHGISCAPAVGRLAAELLLRGASAHPSAADCDPARLAPRARSHA
jgi:D-arginine dehydrogenase